MNLDKKAVKSLCGITAVCSIMLLSTGVLAEGLGLGEMAKDVAKDVAKEKAKESLKESMGGTSTPTPAAGATAPATTGTTTAAPAAATTAPVTTGTTDPAAGTAAPATTTTGTTTTAPATETAAPPPKTLEEKVEDKLLDKAFGD
jgi:hypothetical protein